MTSYYYYVRENWREPRESIIIHVKVGSDSKSLEIFSLVNEFAKDCGIYFHKVSNESDKAIEAFAKGLYPTFLFPGRLLRRCTVTITQLYHCIIDENWAAVEELSKRGKFSNHQDSCFGAWRRETKGEPKGEKPCQAVTRKNLSHKKGDESVCAIISFAIILVIFIICGKLENIAMSLGF